MIDKGAGHYKKKEKAISRRHKETRGCGRQEKKKRTGFTCASHHQVSQCPKNGTNRLLKVPACWGAWLAGPRQGCSTDRSTETPPAMSGGGRGPRRIAWPSSPRPYQQRRSQRRGALNSAWAKQAENRRTSATAECSRTMSENTSSNAQPTRAAVESHSTREDENSRQNCRDVRNETKKKQSKVGEKEKMKRGKRKKKEKEKEKENRRRFKTHLDAGGGGQPLHEGA